MLTNRQKLDLLSALCAEEAYNRNCKDKFLDLFYEVSHPHKKCRHPEWEERAEALYKDFKSKNILKKYGQIKKNTI